MCYAKPGPRCSPHVRKELNAALFDYTIAQESGKNEAIAQTRAHLVEKIAEYDATPAGQKELSAKISENLVDTTVLQKRLNIGKETYAAQKKAYESENPAPKRIKSVSIFRNGSLTPAEYSGEILEYAQKADSIRPEGHAPRHGSLYASPDLKGAGRWIRGNSMIRGLSGKPTHEIKVDPDKIYVYSVKAWEEYSWYGENPQDYWNSAIPLSEWEKKAKEDNLDSSEWEVLIPPSAIISSKEVSNKRIITAQPEDSYSRDDLMAILQRKLWNKGIKW